MPESPIPPDLLPAILAVSLTAIHIVRPVQSVGSASIEDFFLEYVNPAGQQMTGLPERPGGTLLTLFPHTLAAGVFDYYCRVFDTGEPQPYEVYYQADGIDSYFRFQAQRSGDVLVVSFADTSEQDRSSVEQALRESQVREQAARATAERERNLLQAILTQAPVAIGVFQEEGLVVTAANAQMAALWGRSPAQVIGKPLLGGVPELAGQGFDDLLRQVLATQQPIIGTETPAVLRRDGELQTTYYNFVYQPLYDAQGEVMGVIDVAVEVTAQVRTRQQIEQLNQELESRVEERTHQLAVALRQTQEQREQLANQQRILQQILGQVPAAIATLHGPRHRYSFFNESYRTLSGGRAALGRIVEEVLPELVEQGFVNLLDQVYTTGVPFAGQGAPIRFYDAATGQPEQHYINFVYQALRDEQDVITGVLVFVIDVTEQVQAQQRVQQLNEEMRATNAELNKANWQLMRTNDDLDTFVYAASHDLKAPIGNIEGLLDALRDYLPADNQEPMVPQLLHMMQDAVSRFQSTVGHLTDVSRLQQTSTLPAEQVALAALVEDVRLDLAPLLQVADARLTLDIAACPTVHGSPKNLRSILYNLLSNALKYCAPDRPPHVLLRCTCTETHVLLEVQDNGLGLSPDQQTRLFALFRRLHDHVEGSGVGLYMVKKIVENAGGTITVESQLGVGTTFRIQLPHPSA